MASGPSPSWPRERAGWLVAAGYLAFGLAWILFSDRLGELFFRSPDALTRFQTWKGVGFVLFSSLVVLFALGGQAFRVRREPPDARGAPVLVLLSLLVLATALPMVALLGWSILQDARGRMAASEEWIASTAETAAAKIAGVLAADLRLAAAIARHPDVRAMQPRACDAIRATMPDADDPAMTLAVLDSDGLPVCGDASGWNAAPPWWERVRAAPRAFVAPLEPRSDGWGFAVVQPVTEGARLHGAVALRVPSSSIEDVVDTVLPRSGLVAVLDAAQRVVVRWPVGPEFVGRSVRELPNAAHVREHRNFAADGLDGVQRLFGSRPVADTGWTVIAGAPLQDVHEPVRDALLRSLAIGLAVVALCSWLVVRLAGSITRPLRALHRTAAAAAQGDFGQRAPEAGPAELAAVAAGFNRMLERLPELQREVRESAERTAQLVERLSRHVPSMIFVYRVTGDRRARFSYVSHAIRRIFELDPADVREDAKPMFDRIHPDDHERVLDTVRRSGRELAPFELEYRIVLPDGRERHVLALAHAEPSEGETVWYGSVTDVTELHAKEVALREANETLELRITERTADLAAANAALEAFAYSVAHDLRAPLHSIEGFTEGVDHALGGGDVPRALGFTRRVLANAARMNLLIDGFLALAGAARGELDESPVDLDRLVQGVLADLAPAHVRVDVAPLPRVRGDAASLRQVWMNLLSNAVKYSARQADPMVRVDWRLQDGEAQFSIEDNGAGFDPDYAHKLFQPFSRLHKAEEFEGTGVGLAIVRRVVERHGGRCWAEPRAGGGSRFCFALPAARVLGTAAG